MDLNPRTVSQLCGLGQVTWPLCASRFQAVTVDENRYAPLQHVVSPESGSRARESLQGPPCAQSQPCWAPGTLDFPTCPTPRLPAPGTAPLGPHREEPSQPSAWPTPSSGTLHPQPQASAFFPPGLNRRKK